MFLWWKKMIIERINNRRNKWRIFCNFQQHHHYFDAFSHSKYQVYDLRRLLLSLSLLFILWIRLGFVPHVRPLHPILAWDLCLFLYACISFSLLSSLNFDLKFTINVPQSNCASIKRSKIHALNKTHQNQLKTTKKGEAFAWQKFAYVGCRHYAL